MKNELTQERLSPTSLRAVVEALFKTMDWRDPYTASHQKRVGSFAMAIGRQLRWDECRVEALYMAAILHDIGKMAVPYEILIKPSRLTDQEMQIVQVHAEAGYQILKDILSLQPIAEMVHQHHERLDGSGYPRGLKGKQICEEARVIAVADTIDAMATNRPYRPAMGLEAALNELKAEAGTKLDTKVVEAVFQLMKDGNLLQTIIDSQ